MVELTEYIDVAQVTLYVFWAFFAYLVIYLQRESRREGFPLEDDKGNRSESWVFRPDPKTFHLPHGHGTVVQPNDKRDMNSDKVKAEQLANFPGAPYAPINPNPMLDSVGPGAWTQRADVPDMTHEGEAKIVPMSAAKEFRIAEGDMDPRGARVVGCDAVIAGKVTDVWVDKSEQIIRYLQVKLDGDENARSVLVPINFCTVRTPRDKEKLFYVHAITGGQFADVPGTKKKTVITFLEEEKIMAYFGAGLLYATPRRQESVI